MIDVFEAVSLDKEHLFLGCGFGLYDLNCSKIVEKVFDRSNGQCFLINIDQAQKVRNHVELLSNLHKQIQIANHGLHLILDVRSDLYHDKFRPVFHGILMAVFKGYGPWKTSPAVIPVSAGERIPPPPLNMICSYTIINTFDVHH